MHQGPKDAAERHIPQSGLINLTIS